MNCNHAKDEIYHNTADSDINVLKPLICADCNKTLKLPKVEVTYTEYCMMDWRTAYGTPLETAQIISWSKDQDITNWDK